MPSGRHKNIYKSGVTAIHHKVDISVASELVRWKIKKTPKVLIFKVTEKVIFCLAITPYIVFLQTKTSIYSIAFEKFGLFSYP